MIYIDEIKYLDVVNTIDRYLLGTFGHICKT